MINRMQPMRLQWISPPESPPGRFADIPGSPSPRSPAAVHCSLSLPTPPTSQTDRGPRMSRSISRSASQAAPSPRGCPAPFFLGFFFPFSPGAQRWWWPPKVTLRGGGGGGGRGRGAKAWDERPPGQRPAGGAAQPGCVAGPRRRPLPHRLRGAGRELPACLLGTPARGGVIPEGGQAGRGGRVGAGIGGKAGSQDPYVS